MTVRSAARGLYHRGRMGLRTTADGIAILVPLAIEAAAVSRGLEAEDRSAVTVIGPCARSMPVVSGAVEQRVVIVAGVAGALSSKLACGDVLVDGLDASAHGLQSGSIHTADRMLCSPREKAESRAATGADVVDMEHAIVRSVVERAWTGPGDHPEPAVIGVRAVADIADETLPGYLASLVDDAGRTRGLAAGMMVVTRPWRIAGLMRAGRASSVACRSLGGAVSRVIEVIRSDVLSANRSLSKLDALDSIDPARRRE